MSQQNIYPIQLLNDLHNHFPDILYNPGRFNTVQDLLDYVRRVADVNPFTRGMNLYNSRQTLRQNNTNQSAFNPIPLRPSPTSEPFIPNPTVPVHMISTSEPVITMTYEEPVRSVRGLPNHRTQVLPNLNDSVINTLFNSLLGSNILNIPISDNVLQSFLNESVPVYPTNEQITNASTLYRATTQLENNCAICQDDIETDQQVRKLNSCNHYFHKNCIDTWFRQNVHCPTCRQDIREINHNNSATTSPQINIPPSVLPNYRRTNINLPDE